VNFLYPLFLIAALAIAIPIIIHLFNFRKYKKVFFPDIRFLKEIQEQTQKSSQLKHLLILASRILAIASLVFAFAQPFFSKDKEKMDQGPKAISMYLDNSYSMGIENKSLSLLDLAKAKAKQIIESSGSNDQFQILTNDFAYNENRFLSKNEALQQLSTIQLSSKSKKAETILEKQKQLLNTEPGMKKQLIYISDFQKSSFPANLRLTDSMKKYFVSVNATSTNNLSIDTAYFETPSLQLNEPNPLIVKIKNNGTEEMNTSLTLMVNKQLKSVVNTTVKAGELKSEPISFTTANAGIQKIQLLVNDYPVNFDDTFYIAGKVNSNYSVLVLNENNANAFLSSVFKPGTQFRVDNHNVQSVNPALLKNYSLVILNGANSIPAPLSLALNDYINGGGSMMIFPPQNGNIAGLNGFLSKTAGINFVRIDTAKAFVTNYNKSHEVFRDIFVKTPENIDLPIVYKHYLLSNSALSSQQKLFSFSNGDIFLSASKVGSGKMYLCTSAAEITWSNFPKSYWFLPILYKMAFVNSSNNINAMTLGKNATIYIDNTKISDKTVYHIGGSGWDAIPEQRAVGNRMMINANNAVQQAGLYGIYLPDSKDSVFTGINYDRIESTLNYWNFSDLKNTTQLKNAEWLDDKIDVAAGINELQHGMPLWKVCIILALLFLLIEILLIRFMK
jgi:hypothetical protein